MDLNALKTALLVARQGSFAAAARQLDVDPSSVSRTVAQLEDALGFRLFQRSTRTLAITEAGRSYLDRVTPLLEEFEAAKDAATLETSTPSGLVRLTASVAFGQECLVPLLSEFRRIFPDLTLELRLTDAPLDLIENGIDLAIRLAPAPSGDLISTRLLQTTYGVYASPDWATETQLESPSDLMKVDCLRLTLPEYRTRWFFRQAGAEKVLDVPVDGSVILSSPLPLRAAARLGLGPALLADWMVAGDLAAGRLFDVFPGWQVTATDFDTGAYALYPSRRYLPNKVRATLDFIRKKLLQRSG